MCLQWIDGTGVMGVFCRHHHFLLGAFMNSGEKYSYGAYLLLVFSLLYPASKIRNITYDIGPCLWGPWFDVLRRLLPDVPALAGAAIVLSVAQYLMAPFHRNDHKAQCQITHDTARKLGAGVQHGECPEQKWSVAGRQAPRQKGMSLANRHTSKSTFWISENKRQRVRRTHPSIPPSGRSPTHYGPASCLCHLPDFDSNRTKEQGRVILRSVICIASPQPRLIHQRVHLTCDHAFMSSYTYPVRKYPMFSNAVLADVFFVYHSCQPDS